MFKKGHAKVVMRMQSSGLLKAKTHKHELLYYLFIYIYICTHINLLNKIPINKWKTFLLRRYIYIYIYL